MHRRNSVLLMLVVLFASVAGAERVEFVECQKCEKRIRISEDGETAFVNLSRIEPSRKSEMAARAVRLLEHGKPAEAANPLTPLMGWSSWNTFGVDITEDIILSVARTMATNGLKAAGYVYVNIDDGYFASHGDDGRLRFHPHRFPNGLKGTVDGIHALGMKAGAYSDAGADTCGSTFNGDKFGVGAGLYGHDAGDCNLYFGELGFDFFKVDYCGGRKLGLDERERYAEISAAIRATGRSDVRLNICRWAFPGTWAAQVAGSWRTTRDIRANWRSIRDIVLENLYLSAYASPGHFNDMDMLEAGQLAGNLKTAFGSSGDTGLTADEEVAHFGLWCIMSSPLVLGSDVRRMSANSLKLVTNPHLIRMNQDALGIQACVADRDGDAYVLVKDAGIRFGTARYVAFWNAGDEERRITLRAKTVDLCGRIAVFDLVESADIGEFEGEMSVLVRPHAAKFYLLDAERRIDHEVYEAETAFLSDYSELDGTPYGSKESCRRQGRAYCDGMDGASGGVAVVNLGGRETNDIVWRNVFVSDGGQRRVSFRCRATGEQTAFVQVDGGKPVALKCPVACGGFFDVWFDVLLDRGVHVVRVFNPDAPMPDIDYMKILRR